LGKERVYRDEGESSFAIGLELEIVGDGDFYSSFDSGTDALYRYVEPARKSTITFPRLLET
jgi:hypothetical protein